MNYSAALQWRHRI